MSAQKQKKASAREDIIQRYMEYVLEEGHFPSSVYKFCKSNKLEEEDFYKFFGSFTGLQQDIWAAFYDHTENLLDENKEFHSFSNKDKMLSFFYTLFEILTANRSYILLVNDEHRLSDKGNQLKSMRKRIRSFAKELIEDANEKRTSALGKRNSQIFSEAAWWHFMFLLKFWIDDNSAGFEKTDMAIEKSVTTVFDLFDNTPLDSFIDFGKFLFKESVV